MSYEAGEVREYSNASDQCGRIVYVVLEATRHDVWVLFLHVEKPDARCQAGMRRCYQPIQPLFIHSDVVALGPA